MRVGLSAAPRIVVRMSPCPRETPRGRKTEWPSMPRRDARRTHQGPKGGPRVPPRPPQGYPSIQFQGRPRIPQMRSTAAKDPDCPSKGAPRDPQGSPRIPTDWSTSLVGPCREAQTSSPPNEFPPGNNKVLSPSPVAKNTSRITTTTRPIVTTVIVSAYKNIRPLVVKIMATQ